MKAIVVLVLLVLDCQMSQIDALFSIFYKGLAVEASLVDSRGLASTL